MATGVVIRPTIRKIRAKIASQHARSKRSEVLRSMRATLIVSSTVQNSRYQYHYTAVKMFQPVLVDDALACEPAIRRSREALAKSLPLQRSSRRSLHGQVAFVFQHRSHAIALPAGSQ